VINGEYMVQIRQMNEYGSQHISGQLSHNYSDSESKSNKGKVSYLSENNDRRADFNIKNNINEDKLELELEKINEPHEVKEEKEETQIINNNNENNVENNVENNKNIIDNDENNSELDTSDDGVCIENNLFINKEENIEKNIENIDEDVVVQTAVKSPKTRGKKKKNKIFNKNIM